MVTLLEVKIQQPWTEANLGISKQQEHKYHLGNVASLELPLPTGLFCDAAWFGVTYREDRPLVSAALKKLHEEGVYPASLLV